MRVQQFTLQLDVFANICISDENNKYLGNY